MEKSLFLELSKQYNDKISYRCIINGEEGVVEDDTQSSWYCYLLS